MLIHPKKFNWSFHTCINITKVGNFSKSMEKRLPCFYVYGYYKIIVNVSKNSNTLFTHLWTLHFIYHHLFSTHDKWMVAYQKLTYNLCFPPLFNHNQYCYLPNVWDLHPQIQYKMNKFVKLKCCTYDDTL